MGKSSKRFPIALDHHTVATEAFAMGELMHRVSLNGGNRIDCRPAFR
jgi:hypothetical protein